MRKILVSMAAGAALLLGMAAPATAATTGAQTINYAVFGDGESGMVSATGPIQGTGTSVVLTDDGEGSGTDKVTFKGGSFVISHTDSSSTQSFNERTCIGRFSGAGDYTLGSGAGAYKGVSGGGTYTYRGTFFGTRTADGCGDDGTVLFTVRARGTTTLP